MYSVNTIHVDKNVPSCIYEFQSFSMVLKKIFQRIFKIFVEIGKSLRKRGWASNTCAQCTQILICMLVGLSSNCQLYSNVWLNWRKMPYHLVVVGLLFYQLLTTDSKEVWSLNVIPVILVCVPKYLILWYRKPSSFRLELHQLQRHWHNYYARRRACTYLRHFIFQELLNILLP